MFLGYSYLIQLVAIAATCVHFEPKHDNSLFFHMLNERLHSYEGSLGSPCVFYAQALLVLVILLLQRYLT